MNKNEIVIFEEFRLKPETRAIKVIDPRIDIQKLKKLYLYKEPNQSDCFWIKDSDGNFIPTDMYGSFSLTNKSKPNLKKLQRFDTNFYVVLNKYKWPTQWWIKNSNNKLIRIYNKEEKKSIKVEETSLTFIIDSWIRDEAIKLVSAEMRTVKKRPYEYKTEEIEKLIKDKEKEIKRKNTWKAIRTLVLASLGLNFFNI